MQPIKEFTKEVFEKNPSEEKKPEKKSRRTRCNRTHRSTTDPDATIMTKHKREGAYLSYQCHFSVDSENRLVTGVIATTGAVNEGRYLPEIIREQKEKYDFKVKDVTADKQYSATENYVVLDELGIKAYIPVGKKWGPGRRRGYGPEKFRYDRKKHVVICPAGKTLHPPPRQVDKYRIIFCSSNYDCKVCHLEGKCGTTKGRYKVIMVNILQHLKNQADKRCRTKYGRKRYRKRGTTVETIFGEAKTQLGLARAHFRGLKKVGIQFLMTAIALNIKRMVTCLSASFSTLFSLLHRLIMALYRLIPTISESEHYFVLL